MVDDPTSLPSNDGRRAALASCLNKSPEDFKAKLGSRPNCFLMALPLGASGFGTRKVYSVITDREALLAPPPSSLVKLGEREFDGIKYLVFRDP